VRHNPKIRDAPKVNHLERRQKEMRTRALKQMKHKRIKILLICLSVTLLAALSLMVTLAYLQDSTGEAVNTLTLGNVTLEQHENVPGDDNPDWEGDEDVLIEPNQSVAKAPRFTNIGTVPAYVRLTLGGGIGIYDVDYNDQENISGFDNFADVDIPGYWIPDTDVENNNIWYYNIPLPVGGTTEPIFLEIKLPAEYTGESGDNLNITVLGDAIQSGHLEGVAENSPQDAFELFVTPPTPEP
jgi:hypothetical protein